MSSNGYIDKVRLNYYDDFLTGHTKNELEGTSGSRQEVKMLKHILGWLVGAAGVICFVILMPFSIFSGSFGVMVTFGVIGIVLMAIGSYLVRHS